MRHLRIIRRLALVVATLVVGVLAVGRLTAAVDVPNERQQARKLMQDGNYADALVKFRELTLGDGGDDSREIAEDYRRALGCFQQLNRMNEMDEYREAVVKKHPEDWIVLAAVGQSYIDQVHYGFQIAGAFERGNHRGGGNAVHATARDRVRGLQLFWHALEIVDKNPEAQKTSDAYGMMEQFAGALLHGRGYYLAWRLQLLTDLTSTPDYEEGWSDNDATRGAPVDEKGDPLYYDKPASWEAAQNDGERWRWILAKRTAWQPESRFKELRERADFLASQFGVETMANYGWWFAGQQDNADTTKSMFALHTLGDDETIAQLATGIKRFKLPDEQNPIRLNQQIMKEAKVGEADWQRGAESLASTFENRRQYSRAAELWTLLIEKFSKDLNGYGHRLAQIVDNWGRFEPVMTQPAGRGATLEYRYRNGKRVEFTAQPIKIPELISDLKKYIKGAPKQLEWDQMNLDQLGYRLVTKGQDKYVGEPSAKWALDLDPRENHFDRQITVTTPLQKAGAYLVTAKMDGGNTHQIVVWIADTAIVKKPLEKDALYYVADAVSGKPLPKTNVEFFGYWQEPIDGGKSYQVHTKDSAELTDGDGLVKLSSDEQNRRHQWLAVATTPEGRLAYLGFSGVWAGNYYDEQYQQVKVYTITDRPVYRPAQDVHFKFWVAQAKYDAPDASEFAAKSFLVEIHNPRGEKVYSEQLVADAYGGLAGTWKLPEGAPLGEYQLMVVNHGGGGFRVEEYKKPEYEVTIDAPTKPVMLGEKIKAKITAKYYFGSPVTEARVKYKVLRSNFDERWYPPSPWDWLYGPGYWWFGEDYSWYPGWRRWGCMRPFAIWFWRPQAPPEVVAEQEVDIGPDGTVEVEIDTGPAKQFHPDTDHRYTVQAEVVDKSRRTITAEGKVLVARKPFQVYVWAHRGYYRTGDTMHISAAARTIDGKPVEGSGVLKLLKLAYEDGKPVENEVAKWDLPTGAEGMAELQIKASDAGQYRLSYQVTDKSGDDKMPGHKIEGGQVIVVRGENFDGSEFRFNDLELTPDKRDYAPGDKVALQVSANRTGAAVLLFIRPANGVYKPPQMVRLTGKSTVVEIPVAAGDMPNFFVEAVAVHSGKLHTAAREIFVPPSKRVFNVAVTPSAKEYKPGEHAKVSLKLTDADGKPMVGSTVVAVYDKSLDYIAGGAAAADIREFFWKWRRNHQPQNETSLARGESPVVKPDAPQMENVGVFGESTVDVSTSTADFDSLSTLSDGIPNQKMPMRAMAMGGAGLAGAPAAAPALMPGSPRGAMRKEAEVNGSYDRRAENKSDARSGAADVQPAIRQNFADTALWVGALETNAEGVGQVELDMPENLTTWKINVWGMGRGTRVGEGAAEAVTRKNIIVRLQAPRFFVEKDEVVLSANVHNYLKTAKQVRVRLELEGGFLEGPNDAEKTVEIAAGGETRVDWRVKAVNEGEATVRMSALTDEESDAMQMKFPVLVHGMLKTESFSGAIRPKDDKGSFTFTVPEERRPEQSRLEVRYSPTLAGSMVDALPYLVDYPYGCTEQTLNRFLPAVLTQRTLQKLGVDLKDIQKKRTNLNAQEIAPKDGDDAKRAEQWKRFDRNPVYDQAELDKIVKAGVERLTEMQCSDGGWGWFSGWGEASSAHTTATVVRGLLIAKENDVAIVPETLQRGIEWLERYQAEQLAALDNWDREAEKPRDKDKPAKINADNVDALVYMVLIEAQKSGAAQPATTEVGAGPAKVRDHMRTYLYQDRTKLAVYSLATFGLALQKEIDIAKALDARKPNGGGPAAEYLPMIMRNLSQYVRQDDENQTAWLELPADVWWYWYGSEYEAHAYYLKLLAATEPKSEVAPRMVKYLLNNRKNATYWNSTRDTALVVEAFADYLKASGETKPNMSLEVVVDGKSQKTVEITPATLFTFDNKLIIEGKDLATGKHTVELRKKGEGPIYFNGYVTNFTLEDPIKGTGLELKVQRHYYKLTPAEKTVAVAGGRGQAVEQRVEKYDRQEIENLDELTSGDLVEVELVVESKNDYEYIVFEDMKAAGFEPVEVRSGYNGNELGAYVEYHDQSVALFARTLARGRHSVSYRLRAEIPGKFSALPTKASAMYAPELKANSDEFNVQIAD